MAENENSNLNDNKQDTDKNGLEKFYEFDKRELNPEYRGYFDEVQKNLAHVRQVKNKIQQIKKELQIKIAELKQKVAAQQNKAAASQQGKNKEQPKSMEQADLDFCEGALGAMPGLEGRNSMDESTLQNILTTKTKQPYDVIIDIALKPLPSDRAKDKNNDKDKNNGKDKNAEAKEKTSAKPQEKPGLTPQQLQQLRMGKPLSAKPEAAKTPQKTNADNRNITLKMMKQRINSSYGK